MLEKIAVLSIVFGLILAVDRADWKRSGRRERAVYLATLGFAAYLGLDYAMEAKLPHLDELVDWLFTPPASRIVDALKTHG